METSMRLIDVNPLCDFLRERYEYLRAASETQLPGGRVLVDTEIQCGAIIAKEFLDRANSASPVDALIVPPTGVGDVSDGYHTFNELYHHRAVLFSVICNAVPEKAWKSKTHSDGTMFEGMFVVGIDTPEGQATYHYDIDPYWAMFCVKELDAAPVWDGHTADEAIRRIGMLRVSEQKRGRWVKKGNLFECSCCKEFASSHAGLYSYCPNCGSWNGVCWNG